MMMQVSNGSVAMSVATLRELVNDGNTQRPERVLHFRAMMNGRVLREWRQQIWPDNLMMIDMTWLTVEIQHVLAEGKPIQDLRIELVHEQ